MSRLRHPLAAAGGLGLLAGAITAFFLVGSAGETDGWPVEEAEVVVIEEPGALDGLLDDCGRTGGPAREVTLRSTEPPPGLDEVFVIEDECYTDDLAIGEVWRVARVVDDDGTVTAHTHPQPVGEAVRVSVMTAAGTFVAAALLLYGRCWWLRSRERPARVRY